MTERVRSQMVASKMRFLGRNKGVTMFDKLYNTSIRESLDIVLLLFCIKRSQLRWFYVGRMPQKRLPKQFLYAKVNGKRPVGQQQIRLLDFVKDLDWNRLGLCLS